VSRARRLVSANALLALLSTLVAVGAVEWALHRIDLLPDYWDWHGTLVVLDREVLYRLKGHSREDLNALGYRDAEFRVHKDWRTRVAMLGDSFVFGDNVAPYQTLPKALERALGPGFEVWNFGIAGDGPDQSYARMLRDVLRFAPDLIVLCLYPANDFNDLAKNELYVEGTDGKLVYNPENPVARAIPSFRTGILLRKLLTGRGLGPFSEQNLNAVLAHDPFDPILDESVPETAHKIRLMRGVLALFRERLAQDGIPLDVVIIPSLENVQDPAALLAKGIPADALDRNEQVALRLCREERLHCLPLLGPLRARRSAGLYQPGDGHLTPRGTRVAARVIARQLRAVGLLPAAGG
jgi:hypothetical protein